MSFIGAVRVCKSFKVGRQVRPVLAEVSLEVERGEFVSILGAMGCGKSTLLGLLSGLVSPDEGEVLIDGVPVRGFERRAAYVFQNYSLLPWLTALENVRLAAAAALPELGRDAQRARARAMLERVGLGAAVNRRPRQLSGGMRQRVAIARAFVADPQVLFLDEPFGALDVLTRETLQQELARLCSEGAEPVTTVMVTNNVEEAILLSDRIVPMIPGPPATLGAPIPIALARPRTASHLAHDEQAGSVRAHVISTLTAAVARPQRADPSSASRPLVLEAAAEDTT
jgi:nitrate/nitrite transport system ATP-binding protein